MPPVSRFAIPRRFEDAGIRRYGFRGLSFEFIANRLAEISPVLASKRTVAAHLGSDASLCAYTRWQERRHYDGPHPARRMMGTRGGAIDPGVLLYLQQERGRSVDDLQHML